MITKRQVYYRLAKLMLNCGNRDSGSAMFIKAYHLPAWDANKMLSEDGTHWEATDVTEKTRVAV